VMVSSMTTRWRTIEIDAGAGECSAGERLWRLPLDQSQDYLCESEAADLCNIGKPGLFGFGAGSPTAGAKFLEKFVDHVHWAHMDITGVVWSTRRLQACSKGATGYGVRLLDRWIANYEETVAEI
jgi:leucyl aminopeptidase